MAKKDATKPAASATKMPRKSRAKKPVVPAVAPVKSSSPWRRSMLVGGVVAGLVASFFGGVWSTGGWQIGPGPVVRNDVLQKSYDADRVSQVAILRDLAKQPFDGTTNEGRKQAGDWFNAQRFRNRADDFGPYSDCVAEAIDTNSEDKLAEQLE